MYRTQPPGGITGPNSICTYRSTQYTTGYGANHVWTASPSSFVVSSSGPSATVQATSAASGYLKVTYNRLCDNALVTHTTGLYASSCGATMAIAPNPVADVAEISYPDEGKEYEVKVYNSFRRVVAAGKVRRGKLRLDVRSLPKGLYYVHLTDGNAVLVTGKLIKE